MTWLILPISAIIIIICIVVKDYTDGQAQRAEIEYRNGTKASSFQKNKLMNMTLSVKQVTNQY